MCVLVQRGRAKFKKPHSNHISTTKAHSLQKQTPLFRLQLPSHIQIRITTKQNKTKNKKIKNGDLVSFRTLRFFFFSFLFCLYIFIYYNYYCYLVEGVLVGAFLTCTSSSSSDDSLSSPDSLNIHISYKQKPMSSSPSSLLPKTQLQNSPS
jgi:hypothetical protein